MTGKVMRLTDSLYNKPHIVTQERLDSIFDYLTTRNEMNITDQDIMNEAAILKGEYETTELTIEDRVATLNLEGTTVYKESSLDAFCGLLSYQNIVRNVETIVQQKEDIDLVVAVINSPGGEAFRAFETGRLIKELLKDSGIKSVAYVDGIAASGGYVLASAFDEIVSNQDSEVGSIGVRIALKNPKRKEGEPAEVLYITAGENKVPFKSDGSFKEEFIDKLQAGVNDTYDTFVNYIADMRGMTRENVIGTKADTFSAKKAMSLGLVDKVMNGREFVAYVDELKNTRSSNSDSRLLTVDSNDSVVEKELDSELNTESIEVNQSDAVTLEGDNTCVITEVAQSEQSTSIDKIDNKKEESLMTDKSQEVAVEEAVSQEAMLSTQLAEMKAQLAEQAGLVAELKQEKEAIAAAKAEREAQLQAEIDAQEKADFESFAKGLSFVGSDEEKATLSEALFSLRKQEGIEAIVDCLSKAKTAQEVLGEQTAVESVEKEDVLDEAEVRKARIRDRMRGQAINIEK